MFESTSVFFRPLGGLGEIGMNCFALEQGEDVLLVDCGAAFPEDDLGVDLLHPNFDWVVANQHRLRGLVITHGHEDHIGAVPFLLKKLSVELPIFAPAHARALMKERLGRHGLASDCLKPLPRGEEQLIGSFSVEPISVAHSIIDAYALAIRTVAGTLVHTADFDLDEEQPAGHLTDSFRFEELGKEGVRLLLSDSTNIDRLSREGNEGTVGRALRAVIEGQRARVVLAMFSSNIHRLKSLSETAQATGRKLCLLGRSLRRQYEIATELGALRFPSSLLIAPEQLASFPREQVLILAGGSQGEGASALRRLSQGKHPALTLEPDDSVILSSRVIPGNERSVFAMRNDFLRSGIEVLDDRSVPGIHVSGHACRSELGQMMEWTCPEAFVPVHGTLHHLLRHQSLAREYLVQDSAVVEDGAVVEIPRNGKLRVVSNESLSPVRVAMGGAVLEPKERRERSDLARTGCISVSVAIDSKEELLGGVAVCLQGIPGSGEDEALVERLRHVACVAVRNHRGERMLPLETVVKRAVRSAAFEFNGVRSVVLVQIHRLSS